MESRKRKRYSSIRNCGKESTGDQHRFCKYLDLFKSKNPKKNIITVNNTSKRKNASANVELFSFTANSKWELLSKTESDSEVEYLYGYKDVVTPGQTTQSLFDSVTAVNYMEGSLGENDALNIPIEAMAIQWNVDKADVGLKKIYDYYLNQKAVNDKEGI